MRVVVVPPSWHPSRNSLDSRRATAMKQNEESVAFGSEYPTHSGPWRPDRGLMGVVMHV